MAQNKHTDKYSDLSYLPEEYLELDQTLKAAFSILEIASKNRHTLFHTPTLSTFDGNRVSTRTMVLREFDPDKRLIRFHTDFRSVKIEQLKKDSHAAIHGYDPNLKIQIRFDGKINLHHNDKVTKGSWELSKEMSKECYFVGGPPGTRIDDPSGFDPSTFDFESTNGFENFCVLVFQFESMEFLYLKKSGHRRAIHNWTTGEHQSSWLIP